MLAAWSGADASIAGSRWAAGLALVVGTWGFISMRLSRRRAIHCLCVASFAAVCQSGARAWADWDGYAGNAQHTGGSSTTLSQPLAGIKWSAPVDLQPQYVGDDLLIHYGSPMITANNTVIVPVKTGATGGFELQAYNG